MKTKVMLLLLLALCGLGLTAQAGPRVGVFIGTTGGACYRPGPVCGPVAYRPCFTSYQPFFSYWGPTYVSYGSGPSSVFSNVSPLMNYSDGAPVYKVPPPVLPAEPLKVYPVSTFGWKR